MKQRYLQHAYEKGNPHKSAIFRKNNGEYNVAFAGFFFIENEAFEAEKYVIRLYQSEGIVLTNISEGGITGFSEISRKEGIERSRITNSTEESKARLKQQAIRMGTLDHVRSTRSITVSRLNQDRDFNAKKRVAVQKRFQLRRLVLAHLENHLLPEGIELPSNLKTGGTIEFWKELARKLEINYA